MNLSIPKILITNNDKEKIIALNHKYNRVHLIDDIADPSSKQLAILPNDRILARSTSKPIFKYGVVSFINDNVDLYFKHINNSVDFIVYNRPNPQNIIPQIIAIGSATNQRIKPIKYKQYEELCNFFNIEVDSQIYKNNDTTTAILYNNYYHSLLLYIDYKNNILYNQGYYIIQEEEQTPINNKPTQAQQDNKQGTQDNKNIHRTPTYQPIKLIKKPITHTTNKPSKAKDNKSNVYQRHLNQWTRRGHYRVYRNKAGEPIKKIWINSTICYSQQKNKDVPTAKDNNNINLYKL